MVLALLLLPVAAQAPEPVVAEPPEDPRFVAWQRYRSLRREWSLPQKPRSAALRSRAVGWRRAMQRLQHGLRLAGAAGAEGQGARADAAKDVRRCFAEAVVADPKGVEALFALANTTTDAELARLAVAVPAFDDLRRADPARVQALLLPLLDHRDQRVASLAWQQFVLVLDQHGATTELRRRLGARAPHAMPPKQVAFGAWEPNRRSAPRMETLHALSAPADPRSRRYVLAAAYAGGRWRDAIGPGTHDPRIVLLCHSLTAPDVDAQAADTWFGWYANAAAKWHEQPQQGLNAWQYGVVMVLVGVLPRAAPHRLAWLEQNLAAGPVGEAVRCATRHRLLALPNGGPTRDWLQLDMLPLADADVGDLLRIWRRLGSRTSWRLDDCLEVAPRRSPRLRAAWIRHVLLRAPALDAGRERTVLARWCRARDPRLARAACRRLAAVDGGRDVIRGMLPELRGAGAARARLAAEIAVTFRVGEPAAAALAVGAATVFEPLVAAQAERDHESLLALVETAPARRSVVFQRALVAALEEAPKWSASVARFVGARTTHRDAELRFAAYRALRGAAAQQHRIALLAGEAAFDADDGVRSLAVGDARRP
ncbi:MAG: hypothetical protein ACE37K_05860 [Planctomycetota bacterium]